MGLERFAIRGSEISKLTVELVPDWVQVLVHSYYEAGVAVMNQYIAELCLLTMVVGTVIMLTIISSCLDRRRWEVPLVKRMAEIDRKLFIANTELVICQGEVVEAANTARKEGKMVKELDVQLDKVGLQ